MNHGNHIWMSGANSRSQHKAPEAHALLDGLLVVLLHLGIHLTQDRVKWKGQVNTCVVSSPLGHIHFWKHLHLETGD